MDKTVAMRLLRTFVFSSLHRIHRGAESGTTIGLVVAFVGIAIMLSIGVQILGNTSTAFNCMSLNGTGNTSASATGWRGACLDAETSTQNAYALLIVILIVVAAVAILFVVKML